MEYPIRIMLVDDHLLTMQGLAGLLKEESFIEIVGLAQSGEDALDNVVRWNPDVILMDVDMPNGIDGHETTRRLLMLVPEIQVLTLTKSNDFSDVQKSMVSGACGYVKKSSDYAAVLAAINAVYRGLFIFPPQLVAAVSPPALMGATLAKNPNFTHAELKVLCAMSKCEFAIQAADALDISIKTVDAHLAAMRKKLECRKTSTLVKYARDHNLCC